MKTPTFPLLGFVEDRGFFAIDSAEALAVCTFHDLCQGFLTEPKYYDAQGNVWSLEIVTPRYPNNWLTRFLSQTFYDPHLRLDPIWRKQSAYDLGEVRQTLSRVIDRMEAGGDGPFSPRRLKRLVMAATDFAGLYTLLVRHRLALSMTPALYYGLDQMEERKRRAALNLGLGDRMLLGLLAPVGAVPITYLLYQVHSMKVSGLDGYVLKWLLLEFFGVCLIFSVMLFVWVTCKPTWVQAVLLTALRNLGRWFLGLGLAMFAVLCLILLVILVLVLIR